MKKAINSLGYFASLLLATALVFKINHYNGEEFLLTISGLLLSIYIPLYLLEKSKTPVSQKLLSVNYVLAVTVFFVLLGATLKLSHLELGSLFVLLGFACFCLLYSPMLYVKKSKELGAK